MSPPLGPSQTDRTKTHYQILGVGPQCSTADIKSAFLTLSKSHHPDLHPDDPSKHHTFVRIMEAYTVLSKPSLRSTYDSRLAAVQKHNQSYPGSTFDSTTDFDNWTVQSNAPRWRDETIWEMRDRDKDKFYADQPYYGIRGLKRVNNLWIAAGAVMLMGLGAVLHFVALRKSATFSTSRLDARDKKLGSHLKHARNLAIENGNDVQLEILEARLVNQDD